MALKKLYVVTGMMVLCGEVELGIHRARNRKSDLCESFPADACVILNLNNLLVSA
jgi:hypothetical protein